jgi:hypothetical protein
VSAVEAFGIALVVPDGWDARIFRHADGEATLHLASFPLPPADGEFGTRATGSMQADALFAALTEYRPGAGVEPGRGIFAPGPPRTLALAEFGERALLLARPGQRGLQRFCSSGGRAFCLYVVLGGGRRSPELLAAAVRSLRSLRIAPVGAR